MSGTASGNSSSKNRRTSSSVLVVAKLRGPSNSQKSVQVKEPSGFGSAIIMKLFRGQMWSACFSICHEPSGPAGWSIPCSRGRDNSRRIRNARSASASIGGPRRTRHRRRSPRRRCETIFGLAAETRLASIGSCQMSGRRVEIDIGALMIEVDAHIRIALRCFDNSRVERGAADRVDEFVRIDDRTGEKCSAPDLS